MSEDRDVRGELLIQREAARLERKKAKAKAHEENMVKTISAFLKQEKIKRAIAADTARAIKDPSRRKEIFDRAQRGTYDNDFEIITGWEERPWEED